METKHIDKGLASRHSPSLSLSLFPRLEAASESQSDNVGDRQIRSSDRQQAAQTSIFDKTACAICVRSETIGGIPALAAVFGVLTGVLVAVALRPLLRVLRVRDSAAVGLAAGTAGSGIGASSVIPLGPVEAAFAGVGIGMNGLLTAVVAPVLARLLR